MAAAAADELLPAPLAASCPTADVGAEDEDEDEKGISAIVSTFTHE
jgi:hypothetical protein